MDDLTFGVKKGDVFAVVGPNGAGKGTTISMVCPGFQPSTKGGAADWQYTWASSTSLELDAQQAPALTTKDCPRAPEFYAGVTLERWLGRIVHKMASKLSSDNKRGLSLGIALIETPSSFSSINQVPAWIP
ncbi:hypothetical protein BDV95DRAFT_604937 [Massariosphaeria phaeospora]|uniref:ABC transporter domain-containing protein n=1 Tax=Massariosphaeria phaeospora TaxID=100035 RepID=A0A7C8IG77_9PLEO|nr:hypothetical protein BDV95DRAFT_604937 [Massariosphaeria phaeospora]